MKHTPGPWTLHHAKGAFSVSEDGDDERPGYGFVCATGGASLIDEMNAHLIAAAPELLTALKEIVQISRATNRVSINLEACGTKAMLAISKAESNGR